MKMRLVKGPTLHRIIVLVLLSLAGLGHPPNFCEAFKCHCENHITNCKPDASGQVDCPTDTKGCVQIKSPQGTQKGCDPTGWYDQTETVFKCIQGKATGSQGDCIKGNSNQIRANICQCGGHGADCPGSSRRRRQTNDGSAGYEVEICTCRSELCNGGTGGSTGGTGSGAGQGVIVGRNQFHVGIAGIMAMTTVLLGMLN